MIGATRTGRQRLIGAAVLLALALALSTARFYLPVVAGSDSATIRLKERNRSGVTGRATLEAAGEAVWVRITVKGPDRDYLPYLRSGTCTDVRQAVAIPLSLARPGAPGATAIDLPLDELRSGDYVIDVHDAASDADTLFDPGSSVACGIVGTTASATAGSAEGGVQPPITGVGPIESGWDWTMVAAAGLGLVSFVLAVAGLREQRREARGLTIVDEIRIRRLQGYPQ